MILDSGKPYYFSARCFTFVVFPELTKSVQSMQCCARFTFNCILQMFSNDAATLWFACSHAIHKQMFEQELDGKKSLVGFGFQTLAAVFLRSNALQSGIKQQFEVFRHFRFVWRSTAGSRNH